jgi:hypothetical protein
MRDIKDKAETSSPSQNRLKQTQTSFKKRIIIFFSEVQEAL